MVPHMPPLSYKMLGPSPGAAHEIAHMCTFQRWSAAAWGGRLPRDVGARCL